ncbi:MAG TPA: isochorismatase family protein [Hyphomicrobiales bacterium]|nr:isochorismatase family protein [Hyphomicrobiales bacterium]
MANRVWDSFLTPRDRKVFSTAGFADHVGFGARPALLVIDVTYAFCGDRSRPVTVAARLQRTACGKEAWDAVAAIAPLIALARDKGVPVIYTTHRRRPDQWDRGLSLRKNRRAGAGPAATESGVDPDNIVAEIAPEPADIVINKVRPSAFFGTPLTSFLTQLRADTLIVMGGTTSGCIRATVTDAFSHDFRTAVVEDACFDRGEASHAINLWDMHAKYADVVPSSAATDYLKGLPVGLFDLPSGKLPGA